ncbi:hypothetical protein [Kamptonema formosum]|uniref:hypothetical protein n=1 Tax=Kamptonema formosum TaxID=331992 RepID=UPI000349EA22|nr:hypothetical protein [Oscillatoria sp. PCC 10802]
MLNNRVTVNQEAIALPTPAIGCRCCALRTGTAGTAHTSCETGATRESSWHSTNATFERRRLFLRSLAVAPFRGNSPLRPAPG